MDFLNWLRVVFLGIVEGVTEWLPISSTGHLIIVDELWKGDPSVFTESFLTLFNVVIQLGAILAVVVYFFHRINPFSQKKTKAERTETWQLWFKIALAIIPAIFAGLFLDDWMDEHLYNYVVVGAMLIIYGIAFLIVENRNKNKAPAITRLKNLDYKTAFFIGLAQLLALVPGTSRSGVTILAALFLGTSRYVASEFTFFLGIPVMFGASVLKGFKYFFIEKASLTGTQCMILLVAMAVSFAVSMFVVKFLMNYVKKHDFKPFGIYRIVLGVLVFVLFYFLNLGAA